MQKKPKEKLHYLCKMQARIQENNAEPNCTMDPVLLVSDACRNLQDESKAQQLQKDFQRSHREFFNDVIVRIRDRFNANDVVASSSSSSSSSNGSSKVRKALHDQHWQVSLCQAVKMGRPADFSGMHENRIYADNKLIPRCRYLYDLVLQENTICNKIRTLLFQPKHLNNEAMRRGGTVHVCSMGGGPGYDHIALCIVVEYLFRMKNCQEEEWPQLIQTQVFDLYNREWEPIMMEMQDAMLYGLGPRYNASTMTMHYGDIRSTERLEGELGDAIQNADIIVFQFVLHENASSLLSESGKEIGGAVLSILQSAKQSSIMICTDSSNRMWPALQATADRYGWVAQSTDAGNLDKMFLGPKSYVLLERVNVKDDGD